jgi:glutamate receptor 3
MFDGTKVILDAYNRLLKKKVDMFRNNFRRGEFYNNGTRGIDCRKLAIIPWEHGDRISKSIRKVSIIKMLLLLSLIIKIYYFVYLLRVFIDY